MRSVCQPYYYSESSHAQTRFSCPLVDPTTLRCARQGRFLAENGRGVGEPDSLPSESLAAALYGSGDQGWEIVLHEISRPHFKKRFPEVLGLSRDRRQSPRLASAAAHQSSDFRGCGPFGGRHVPA